MLNTAIADSITITTDNGFQFVITDIVSRGDNSASFRQALAASCVNAHCGPTDLRRTDDELNRIYHELKRKLSKADAKKLRDLQRSWIRNRDSECGIEYKGSDPEKWLGHVLGQDSRTVCVIRVTTSRTSEMQQQLRQIAGIRFVDTDVAFHGQTQQDWARQYWMWERQYPAEQSPAADLSGVHCMHGQHGDVWFLTGSTKQNAIERQCTIEPGTALVVPVLISLAQTNPGKHAECHELQKQINAASAADTVYFSIDGIDYTKSALQHVITPCFTLEDKRNGFSGDAIGAGQWVFLDPLPPGEHTVRFGGRFHDGFRQDVTYKLTVKYNCSIPLHTQDVDVIGIGQYHGLDPEAIQLGASGHEVRSSKVIVNQPGKPVLLVLSAYDPTWWKVAVTPGTILKGIILTGYHTQAVTGISKSIPMIKAVYEEKGSCNAFYFYKTDHQLDSSRKNILAMTGHPLQKLIIEAKDGAFVVGAQQYDPAKLIVSNDYIIEDYQVKRGLPAGQKGIDQLLLEGKLRLATPDDIKTWVDAASEKYRDLNPNLKVEHGLNTFYTYVVLKPVTLPTGMYGGHSRRFLIPKDMPKPNDPGSHNSYYFMGNGTCVGAICK